MAMQECKRAILGKALEDLVARARSGKEPCRIGLMASGGEHSDAEFLAAASAAMSADPALTVVGVGPKPSGILPQGMDWIETGCEGPELASGMENALAQGHIHGAVALHYPFPLGVTTVGRVLTPGTGKPLFMASCTGMSAAHRQEAMLRNAILGVAVAKALGITCPSVGVLNLDAAPQVLRALNRMAEKGYHLNLGQSVRGDGGSLLRGNDLLCGAVDVCVADTLTGNVLMKVFSAFTSGGSYETSGWGYGPSVGEGWDKVVASCPALRALRSSPTLWPTRPPPSGAGCPPWSRRKYASPKPRAWMMNSRPFPRPRPLRRTKCRLRPPCPRTKKYTALTCSISNWPSVACGKKTSTPKPRWAAPARSSNWPVQASTRPAPC